MSNLSFIKLKVPTAFDQITIVLTKVLSLALFQFHKIQKEKAKP